jgi:CDP-diglyceride synthetase
MSFSHHCWIVIFPLILSNALHMWLVKKDVLAVLNRPIWKWGFGSNKTFRGFFLVPVLNMTFLFLCHALFGLTAKESWIYGCILGLCYVLAELPNSFLKRRLGIQAGMSNKQTSPLFIVFDKTDSALGVSIGYFLLSNIEIQTAKQLFFCSVLMHVLFSYLLVKLRVKSSF